MRDNRLPGLHVAFKIVEDRLPACFLHFGGVFRLCLESLGDGDHVAVLHEGDAHFAVVFQHIFDAGVGLHSGIGACEIKAKTAVAGLHAARELAADTEVDRGAWRVLIV